MIINFYEAEHGKNEGLSPEEIRAKQIHVGDKFEYGDVTLVAKNFIKSTYHSNNAETNEPVRRTQIKGYFNVIVDGKTIGYIVLNKTVLYNMVKPEFVPNIISKILEKNYGISIAI